MSAFSQEAFQKIVAYRDALNEIVEIAKSSEIPDRWGAKHQACDTTCLKECATIAKKALEQ